MLITNKLAKIKIKKLIKNKKGRGYYLLLFIVIKSDFSPFIFFSLFIQCTIDGHLCFSPENTSSFKVDNQIISSILISLKIESQAIGR